MFDRFEIKRFEEKFRVTPGCWIWEGSRNAQGYGHFKYEGDVHKAHRIAYLMYVGEFPRHLVIMHRCDNPWCVNPEHLQPGTNAENTADRDAKGRKAVGEANGKSKLTNAQCHEMRRLLNTGMAREDVAEMFGVSGRTVWYALKTRGI
jgi:hypothetical protein